MLIYINHMIVNFYPKPFDGLSPMAAFLEYTCINSLFDTDYLTPKGTGAKTVKIKYN